MKKIILTIISLSFFLPLTTNNMYPMEPHDEDLELLFLEADTEEKIIFQPKSLKEQSLSIMIRGRVQPALDQLSIDTFHEVHNALLTLCNESSNFIATTPIKDIIKINNKEEIPYTWLKAILKEYNAPEPLLKDDVEQRIITIEETITYFLGYILLKDHIKNELISIGKKEITEAMIHEQIQSQAQKKRRRLDFLHNYYRFFIILHFEKITANLNSQNIDELYKAIENFTICDDSEKKLALLNINRMPEFKLRREHTCANHLALLILIHIDEKYEQFITKVRSTSYLYLNTLKKEAKELYHNYQTLKNSIAFSKFKTTSYYKDEIGEHEATEKTFNLMNKNLYIFKGLIALDDGTSYESLFLNEAKDIGKECLYAGVVGALGGILYKVPESPAPKAAIVGASLSIMQVLSIQATINSFCLPFLKSKKIIKHAFGIGIRFGLVCAASKVFWEYAIKSPYSHHNYYILTI